MPFDNLPSRDTNCCWPSHYWQQMADHHRAHLRMEKESRDGKELANEFNINRVWVAIAGRCDKQSQCSNICKMNRWKSFSRRQLVTIIACLPHSTSLQTRVGIKNFCFALGTCAHLHSRDEKRSGSETKHLDWDIIFLPVDMRRLMRERFTNFGSIGVSVNRHASL